MQKNNVLLSLTIVTAFFSQVIFTSYDCRAQIPCYNICQKTVIHKDCQGGVVQTVEFINIPCDQKCPADEHYKTVCPCTWELWREITEIDCEGVTHYSKQLMGYYPCGTEQVPDKSYTIPCVKINGQSSTIHRSESYFIHQNNCVCDEFEDITYQFLDMDCKLYCRKIVTREFCNGSIVQDPPELVEIPCPGDCLPDNIITDTVCEYECGVITTYYDCDDPETIDYIEPMKTFASTYDCSGHEMPDCPPDEEFFEDCDVIITGKDLEPEKFQRRVARKYELLRKDCTKAVRISTVYEKAY